MSGLTASFHRASDLVAAWGRARIGDGATVEEILTLEGIPFWSVVAPMLAFGHIPRVLSPGPGAADVARPGGALASKARRLAVNAALPLLSRRAGCARWPEAPPFLFLGFSHYMYRDTLRPVAGRMAARPGLPVMVLDDVLPARPRKPEPGEPAVQSLWLHWDGEVGRTVRKLRAALDRAAGTLFAPSGLPEVVSSSGLAWRDVKGTFDRLLDGYFPRLLGQAAIALHIMERHRPALLVSPDVHDPRTRVFCLAGRLSGVRTLEIQFGFYGVNDVEWRFFAADRLAVTGEANLEVMAGHGVPREAMVVTGSPRYDGAASWSSGASRSVRTRLGVPDGKAMALFASQPYYYGSFDAPESRSAMIRALFRRASALPGLVLVVKPHPLEDPAELERMAGGAGNIRIADRSADIRGLIGACDAFVTFFSQTAFDALVLNRLTINLAFPGGCANDLFERSGATVVARSESDVAEVLRSVVDGRAGGLLAAAASARDAFLRSWFYRLDGRSAERIEALAMEMARPGDRPAGPRRP